MSNSEEEIRQEFISKLRISNETIEKILKTDPDALVINGDDLRKLEEYQKMNQAILKKLENKEFTVAVVGLEKAGKSTLGNAMIKQMILPEYETRCTYTTTEIRFGSTDNATVHFYSNAEFNNRFRSMLRDLNFPQADNVSFATMTLQAFNTYWNQVKIAAENDERSIEASLVKDYDTSTAADIKLMLSQKNVVEKFLGHKDLDFDSTYWNPKDKFNDFKQFITGMTDDKGGQTAKPYAVKNVVVESTELDGMENIVLYDVPGFDSPTELHRRQTAEMLKKADAIILVMDLSVNSRLTKTHLDVLRQNQDEYGIKLSEKAFIFGNRLDHCKSIDEVHRRIKPLINDFKREKIITEDHFFYGSARAYLERIGKMSFDDLDSACFTNIDKLKLPNSDGVDALHEGMKYYYDNDRFAVLQRRAEVTVTNTRDLLKSILESHRNGEIKNSDLRSVIKMKIQSRLSTFIKESQTVTMAHVNKIDYTKPFTTAMKASIEDIYPLIDPTYMTLIKDVETKAAINPNGIYPTSKVDNGVRDELKKIFIENIVSRASQLTTEHQQELRNNLVEKFLEIMGMESQIKSEDKAALEKSVNELFDHMLIEGGENCNFNPLVERFVTSIILTLILNPFATPERLQQIQKTFSELISLAMYYNIPMKEENESIDMNLDDIGKESFKFFAMILAHEGIEDDSTEDDSEESINIKKSLENLFNSHKGIITKGAALAVDILPMGKWAKLLMRAGINLMDSQNTQKLDNKLRNLFSSDDWIKFNKDQRIKAIENEINNCVAEKRRENKPNENDGTITSQLNELYELAKDIRKMDNKEDMITTLDTDIKILRKITEKAVINAIGLETAFISVVTKNVELIRKHLEEDDGTDQFITWIDENSEKLMHSKFQTFIEEEQIRNKRNTIVEAISESMKTLTA